MYICHDTSLALNYFCFLVSNTYEIALDELKRYKHGEHEFIQKVNKFKPALRGWENGQLMLILHGSWRASYATNLDKLKKR